MRQVGPALSTPSASIWSRLLLVDPTGVVVEPSCSCLAAPLRCTLWVLPTKPCREILSAASDLSNLKLILIGLFDCRWRLRHS